MQDYTNIVNAGIWYVSNTVSIGMLSDYQVSSCIAVV